MAVTSSTRAAPRQRTKATNASEALAQTLKAALALVDIRVFDRVIVGGDKALSMAEKGLL
jgi:DNA repair protein RadC